MYLVKNKGKKVIFLCLNKQYKFQNYRFAIETDTISYFLIVDPTYLCRYIWDAFEKLYVPYDFFKHSQYKFCKSEIKKLNKTVFYS